MLLRSACPADKTRTEGSSPHAGKIQQPFDFSLDALDAKLQPQAQGGVLCAAVFSPRLAGIACAPVTT
jgi:hypothetical protein